MSKDEFNHKYLAKEWFENLRDEICDSLEECERILVGGNDAAQKSLGSFERTCLLYTSPSPRDKRQSRMPSSA